VKRYRTIVADPPWRYTRDPGSLRAMREAPPRGRGRQAEDHYPTMTTEEIAALPVASLADDHAFLYLWVTNPLLTDQRPDIKGRATGPDIARAWGFEPKALVTWVKTGIGPGWYFRGKTEHAIFAVRGNAKIAAADRVPNIFEAEELDGFAFDGGRGRHSQKPDVFFDMVQELSPGPYVELFARRGRFGWDYWGDESLQTVSL
jgi:N6-adenosine-specific RNA methylase IME4